jgi:heat shock protein HslJ
MSRAPQVTPPSHRSARGTGLGATAIAAALIVTGCAKYEPTRQTLSVAPDPVDCADGTPGVCINVTDAAGDTWITRPAEIVGFTYEPGYTYELLVEEPSEVSEMEAPEPARPRLIRILSKQPAGAEEPASTGRLDQGTWLLARVGPSGHAESQWAASGITARFDVAGSRLSGFAGCNDYSASLAVTDQRIEVSAPVSTRKACSPETTMELEQEYLRRIAGATTFVVTADRLELSLADGGGMAFERAAR